MIVGAGRLGASLALALREHGAVLAGYSAPTAAGRSRADGWLGGQASAELASLATATPDLYVVTVPDQALAAVAVQLGELLAARAPTPPPGAGRAAGPPVVLHTSGATSVEVLAPCEQAGAATLAFHPLQTFSDPATGRARFAGAAVALTPADPDPESPAALVGFALARALGAKPFLLADDKRPLYHAAATVACNYLVTLEHQARRLFVLAGLPEDEALSLFLPLVAATLDNLGRQGAVRALTGPLSRGDVATIEGHLTALRTDAPDLLPLYSGLGLATLDIVKARGDVPDDVIAALERLLETPAQPADTSA